MRELLFRNKNHIEISLMIKNMWERSKTLLKAQKEKPPNKGQSPMKGALQSPLRRDVTTLKNPPQSGPPQSGKPHKKGNMLSKRRKKKHPRVVQSRVVL